MRTTKFFIVLLVVFIVGLSLSRIVFAAEPYLVKDIWPGSDGSHPGDLVNVNGTLFFTASDGARGFEL